MTGYNSESSDSLSRRHEQKHNIQHRQNKKKERKKEKEERKSFLNSFVRLCVCAALLSMNEEQHHEGTESATERALGTVKWPQSLLVIS